MCVGGAFEEIVSPLSSSCPTHSGSARVEEERHPLGGEGGCGARVIHFRHLWLRRWASEDPQARPGGKGRVDQAEQTWRQGK